MATLKDLWFSPFFSRLLVQNLYYWSYDTGNGTKRNYGQCSTTLNRHFDGLTPTVFEIFTFKLCCSLQWAIFENKCKKTVSSLTQKLFTIDLYCKQQFVQLTNDNFHAKFSKVIASGCYGNPEKVAFLAVFCLNFAVLALHYSWSYDNGNSTKRKFDSFLMENPMALC